MSTLVMETRRLGDSDLLITPLGMGAWAIGGGGWQFAWGPQDDDASIHAINRALDAGVNWIDTAAVYGLGHSEDVVARALTGRAERPYVFTKCGLVWDDKGNTMRVIKPDSIRRELEASLRRLQTDTIDLYQIHWPPESAARNAEIDDAIAAMVDARDQGKIRYIGVSNFNVEQLERGRHAGAVASLQPPYSPINRKVEQAILPYCLDHHIGVIVYSPMASGLLSGAMTRERIERMPPDDWRRRSSAYREPDLTRNLAVADVLRQIGARYEASAGEVAIAWTLRHPAVTGAIVGARSPGQVDGWIGAAALRLTDAEVAEINQQTAVN